MISNMETIQNDVKRGKWSCSIDFFLTNMSFSLGFTYFLFWSYIISTFNNWLVCLIPYSVGLLVFSIPIFFVQSSIGQFSSSGVLSVYRLAPLYKGIGYAILFLNLCSVSYFAVHAAFSIIYFISSVYPNSRPNFRCNNSWDSGNYTNDYEHIVDANDWLCYSRSLSRSHLGKLPYFESYTSFKISSHVLHYTILVWMLIGVIVINKVQTVGKIIRFITIITIIIFITIFTRLIFLNDGMHTIRRFRKLHWDWEELFNPYIWIITPFLAIFPFGAGLGTTLTLASFNKIDTKYRKFSIINPLIHMVIFVITGIMTVIVHDAILHKYGLHLQSKIEPMFDRNVIFQSFSLILRDISGSNIWSMLFCLMVFMGELMGCVVQMLTILTGFLDEFSTLRHYRKNFTLILLFNMFFTSILFSLYQGYSKIGLILNSILLSQMFISCIEILIILWAFGASRFRRDIKFMIGEKVPMELVNIIRIVVPSCMAVIFISQFIISNWYIDNLHFYVRNTVQIVPIFIMFIYMVYKLYNSTGNFCHRVIKLCTPEKWLPADVDDQTRYIEFIDNNVTFQRI